MEQLKPNKPDICFLLWPLYIKYHLQSSYYISEKSPVVVWGQRLQNEPIPMVLSEAVRSCDEDCTCSDQKHIKPAILPSGERLLSTEQTPPTLCDRISRRPLKFIFAFLWKLILALCFDCKSVWNATDLSELQLFCRSDHSVRTLTEAVDEKASQSLASQRLSCVRPKPIHSWRAVCKNPDDKLPLRVRTLLFSSCNFKSVFKATHYCLNRTNNICIKKTAMKKAKVEQKVKSALKSTIFMKNQF